jgi:N,N-dimethylformamidase
VPIGAGAAYRPAFNFSAQGTSAPVKGPLRFGQGYSGKISGPAFTLDGALAAHWDFSVAMTTQTVPGMGPQGRALALVNAPKRAVTGPAWTGEAHDWRQAPTHYDAIHFHDDDIADCAWPSVHDIALPEDLSSGVYAFALTHASGGPTHRIPLFVRPRTTPQIVFLASTLSYLAYANSLWASPSAPALEAAYPDVVGRMRGFGLSTYSRHRDGSGIGLVSTHRPTLNLTPGFLGEAAGGQSLLNDDLRILAWLEWIGEPYGVLTDHDLHREGVKALKGCAVLVTGAHPEYQSRETLDAIEAFQGRGGRLLYLGGNGFYWRVSMLPDAPHVMEVRRAESGIRMWAEPPGEYHHQSDGGLGGLWRRLGRPPNRLVGVGYSAQGDEAPTQPYRRMPAGEDPRTSFLFEGVDSAVFGRSSGIAAAAGYELDRADPSLGTPAHALVVARSEPFSDGLYPVNEERLTHTVIDAADPLRADLTFFETPSGGATLSVGSVFFPLALEEEDGAGRLARNALQRFLDPTPFAMPAEEDPS